MSGFQGRACVVRGWGAGGGRELGGALAQSHLDPSFLHTRVRVKGQDGQGQTLKGTSGGAEPGEAAERVATDFSGDFSGVGAASRQPGCLQSLSSGPGAMGCGSGHQATAGTPRRSWGLWQVLYAGPQCHRLSSEANTLKTPSPPHPAQRWPGVPLALGCEGLCKLRGARLARAGGPRPWGGGQHALNVTWGTA